ncbi:hypothetical protein BJY24_003643 [Nocardia transvalensis]|uniref:Stress-induced protein n=1 Tax=Nocardia transvalensis TaxID=37333 RepID=A0A7W9UIY9_9NOCA|nr:hypothetical protein [Nocardia transvalensis]MBB5914776.1 hypothetical protein [Nocardia transvalensis]
MPNPKNRGQFGNRPDTAKQARKGGLASTGSFGSAHSADPSEAGRKGAAAQPTAAKSRGGQHSHSGR